MKGEEIIRDLHDSSFSQKSICAEGVFFSLRSLSAGLLSPTQFPIDSTLSQVDGTTRKTRERCRSKCNLRWFMVKPDRSSLLCVRRIGKGSRVVLVISQVLWLRINSERESQIGQNTQGRLIFFPVKLSRLSPHNVSDPNSRDWHVLALLISMCWVFENIFSGTNQCFKKM